MPFLRIIADDRRGPRDNRDDNRDRRNMNHDRDKREYRDNHR